MRRTIAALALTGLSATVAPAQAIPPAAAGALASDNIDHVVTIPDAGAIGAKIVDGYMYVTTVAGLRIYDVSEGVPVLTGVLNLPHFENEQVDSNGEIALISVDGFVLGGWGVNLLFVIDVRNKNLPVVQGVALQDDGHTATCVADCTYAYTTGGEIFDLRDPSKPTLVGSVPNGSAHNWNVDATNYAWGEGHLVYDASNPRSPVQFPDAATTSFGWHNSIRPNANNAELSDGDIDAGEVVIGAGEDLYDYFGTSGNCNGQSEVRTTWVRKNNGNLRLSALDKWSLGTDGTMSLPEAKPATVTWCSAHWLDYHEGLVAVGWYEQGTRILDVSNPKDIRQVGYFMPAETQTWATYFQEVEDGPFGGGLYVYAIDVVRGIDVFKVDATAGVSPTVLAPRLNPSSPAFVASEEFGWACRVPNGSDLAR